jgi:hypothetical protein
MKGDATKNKELSSKNILYFFRTFAPLKIFEVSI